MKMTSKNHQKKSANFLDLSSMIPNVQSEFLEKVVIWTTLVSTETGLDPAGQTLSHDFSDFSTLGGVRPSRWVSTETGLDPAGPT